MKEVTKSRDGKFASEKACFNPASKKETKAKWIADHELFIADGRAFALVKIKDEIYFMDAMTGCLFAFGECQSSNQIVHSGFKIDQEGAAKILMSMSRDETE